MNATYLQRLRLFSRDVRLFLFSMAMVGFAYFGVSSVLFNLYLLRLGYGPRFVGQVNAAGFLVFALFGLPAGVAGSRWGSRPMMIVGTSLIVAGALSMPVSQFMSATLRTGWLLVTNSVTWLAAALWMANTAPFLMAATAPEERNHVFSVRSALLPFAGFVGSFIGGLLPECIVTLFGVSIDRPAPYGYPLFVIPLLYGLALLALLATGDHRQEHVQEVVAGEGRAPYGLVMLVALVTLLLVCGEWSARVFFNVYLDAGLSASTPLIGAFLAIGQVLSVPAALAMPPVVKRLGKESTIICGSLGLACSLLPLALIPHWGAAGLGMAGISATTSIMYAAFNLYSQEIMPTRWRPVAAGATSTAMGLGCSTVAFGGGYIISAMGYRSLFLLGAALVVAGSTLFWVFFRVPRGELDRGSTQPRVGQPA